MDERDRRLAYQLCAGILRRQAQLDRQLALSSTDGRLHDILRLGLYQLRHLDRVPAHAAVSTSVELARARAGEGAARFVNQALRKLAAAPAADPDVTAVSHPEWLVRRWTSRFGPDAAAKLIAWNDAQPALTLQPARWSGDELARRLRDAGFGVTQAPFGAGLRPAAFGATTPRPAPRSMPGFAEGGFLVQDAAQLLVTRFAAIPAGDCNNESEKRTRDQKQPRNQRS